MCAFVLGGGLWSFGVFAQPNLCGDVTGDGDITIADARQIMKCATHRAECPESCDVTGDGRCNTSDARMVQRAVAQQLSSTDFQCPVAETLTLTVVSDKESYEIGETPILTFTLTNVSDAPVVVSNYARGNIQAVSVLNPDGTDAPMAETEQTSSEDDLWRVSRLETLTTLEPGDDVSFEANFFRLDTHQGETLLRVRSGLQPDYTAINQAIRSGIAKGVLLQFYQLPSDDLPLGINDLISYYLGGIGTFLLEFEYSYIDVDENFKHGPVISNQLEIFVQ